MGIAGPTNELRLLADPTRSRIVSLIMDSADGRLMVGPLAAELGLRQPTVSHHLKILVEAGLLSRAKRGIWSYYAIVPGALEELAATLRPTE